MLAHRHLLTLAALLLSAGVGGQARQKEAKDHYRKWLETDVAYIITPEEEAVFKKLTADEERQIFIEQFWHRRDPNPATEENEFKVEHYRRIAHANEAFAAGIPGWKTDRGRTYIVFGAPDETETHAGGSYTRRIEEGGGGTSVFPFERWYYRHIPEVGSNIELEFVDDTGGSLYRLAVDEHTKDALFYTPSSGLTLAESVGLVDKGTRVLNRFLTNPQRLGFGAGLTNDPIKPHSFQNAPFERLYRLFELQKPPRQEFRDLRSEVMTSINYQALPFDLSLGVTHLGQEGALAPVTVEIDPRELTFRPEQGFQHARVSLYARLESLDRRIFKEFERDLDLTLAAGSSPANLAAFQNSVPLRPGLYKVTVLVKDNASGKTGARVQSLRVPALPSGRPEFSTILLARSFAAPGSGEGWLDPFVLGPLKVHVNPTRVFERNEAIGVYVELYNADTSPGLRLSARLVDKAGRTQWQAANLTRELGMPGGYLYLAKELRLPHLAPGDYRLIMDLRDDAGQLKAEGTADMTLK